MTFTGRTRSYKEEEMSKNFDAIMEKVTAFPMKKLAVAVAQDKAVLEAVKAAKERGIADSILVGDADEIKKIGAELSMDMSQYRIIDEKDVVEASLKAVKLVHDGEADMYMKGLLPTGTFLKSVLNKEVGLRTGKPLSHVCVFEIPGFDRLLFLTDVAFIPYPTLEDKKCMIDYTVEVANACGVENPKVACLAALETVNEKMPCTVDAAELSRMQDAGEIKDCVVDGPLSMDIALYKEAAEEKGALGRKVAGDANILVFPDIHAGNLVYKTMVHMIPCINGNILTGTKAPVILTSRSDTMEVKLNSIALAAVVAQNMQ
jgi:phosphate butyryltransferase